MTWIPADLGLVGGTCWVEILRNAAPVIQILASVKAVLLARGLTG
jgi:hypothetical protein